MLSYRIKYITEVILNDGKGVLAASGAAPQ